MGGLVIVVLSGPVQRAGAAVAERDAGEVVAAPGQVVDLQALRHCGAGCPPLVERQYATVPLTSTSRAGRGARTGTGANAANRAAKSMSMLNRLTGSVSSRYGLGPR